VIGKKKNSPPAHVEDPERSSGRMSGKVTEYTEWLTSSLSRYEKLAKSLIKHKGEKGRILESVVKSALCTMLPRRFSLGSGFAITSSGKSSQQLDLVIYDTLDNSPITFEGGIWLFPIECIYGFVEVKSILNEDASKAPPVGSGATECSQVECRRG
jgi:hypothetical protein